MKKCLKIIFRISGILIIVILLAGIIIPSLFKEQIKEKVVSLANEKVNAKLAIGDFGLTIFRNFPNLTFRIKDVSITGIDKFEGDTLAGVRSFNLVFDLGSVLSKEGYRIKAIEIDRPVANAVILKDGMANYDIITKKEDSGQEPEEEKVTGKKKDKEISLRLNNFEIKDGIISYKNIPGVMETVMSDLDLIMKGNMAKNKTDLALTMNIEGVDMAWGGIEYLNDATVSSRIDIGADLQDNTFQINDNFLAINALKLIFDGSVQLDETGILTDLVIGTDDTDLKSVLSLVPSIFLKGFEELYTEGSFSISGNIKGRYSSADSLLPDVMLELLIKDGYISYPELPEKISDINLSSLIEVDGSDLDKTIIDLMNFHFELADNPFDMDLRLSTPISDPNVEAELKGRIDLEALAGSIPVNVERLKGIIDIGLGLRGKMSMIEKNDFDSFYASGDLEITGFELIRQGVPPFEIEVADFSFAPQFLNMQQLSMDIAGNNLNMSGQLENYLPFIFKNETVRGKLELYSNYIDLDTILTYLPADTLGVKDDTLAIPTIRIPENIDFEFVSVIDSLTYLPLRAYDIRGNIIMRDGVLLVSNTGLLTLGGDLILNAEYDSNDTINPRLKADLSIEGLGIKQSFNTFNTVRKLAPVAEGMNGYISMVFDFSAILGEGMIPIVESMDGSGNLITDEIQLLSSPIYDKFNSVMKLGDNYSNTFKDVDVNFEIKGGRVYVKPFDTRLGNMKVNISGDHGLDQSINYMMKLEIPSSMLPQGMSNLLTGLAANAALMGIEYYQPEIIKMNVNIGGSIKDPQVRPSLGQNEGNTVNETLMEAAGDLVDKKADQIVEQVSDEARRQADKIMAEAQKRADLIKAEAAEAAGKLRQEGEKNAQKLIDEAADKGALARLAADRAAVKLRQEAEEKAASLEEAAMNQADRIMEEARARADEILK